MLLKNTGVPKKFIDFLKLGISGNLRPLHLNTDIWGVLGTLSTFEHSGHPTLLGTLHIQKTSGHSGHCWVLFGSPG